MKLYQVYLISAVLAGLVSAGCSSDESREALFDSKLYITAKSKTEKIALKSNVTVVTKTLQVGVPKPAEADINVVFKDDPTLVATYNSSFYDEAILLPADYYTLDETKTVLQKGTVLSNDMTVSFKDLNLLPRGHTYVLPMTIASADNIAILQSARTFYYVLKESASINVVADLEKKNFIGFPSFKDAKPSGAVCNDLSQFTFEALIRARGFPSGIQTIMGIEGYFLLRISDNGLAPNQLQFATPYGSLSSDECMLTANKWTHIAVTYDMVAKENQIYIDGVLVARKDKLMDTAPASFGKPMGPKLQSFYIGFSYEAGRELDGEVSECRIWNVVRTQEEIAGNIYEVEPKTPGLVAYWKFDEGAGDGIRDHTDNGNDGKADAPVKWTPVTLPAPVQ